MLILKVNDSTYIWVEYDIYCELVFDDKEGLEIWRRHIDRGRLASCSDDLYGAGNKDVTEGVEEMGLEMIWFGFGLILVSNLVGSNGIFDFWQNESKTCLIANASFHSFFAYYLGWLEGVRLLLVLDLVVLLLGPLHFNLFHNWCIDFYYSYFLL